MDLLQSRKTESGWKFDILAGNGEILAVSEVYHSLQACRKGMAAAEKAAARGETADLTAGEEPEIPNPRFEVYLDRAGAYRFRLRARNGKIVVSSEPYTTKAACEKGIRSIRHRMEPEN